MFFQGFGHPNIMNPFKYGISRQVISKKIWLISRMTMNIVAFNTLKYKGHLQGAAILDKQIMQRWLFLCWLKCRRWSGQCEKGIPVVSRRVGSVNRSVQSEHSISTITSSQKTVKNTSVHSKLVHWSIIHSTRTCAGKQHTVRTQ